MTEPYRLVPHPADACVAFGEKGDRLARDLLCDVASVARALPASEGGSEVLIICQDRYHFAVGLLAAWQKGHAVALPPNGQPETIHALAHASGVKLLLHDVHGPQGLDLRGLLSRGEAGEPLSPIAPDRPIATLYTSGSTGAHQPCPKKASQLLGEALSHVGTFALGPGTRVVATVPGHHIYGLLYSVLAPLLGGGAFLRETPLHAETIAAALARHRADVLVSVPAHLRGLESLESLPAPRRTFSSGAALPPTTAAMLRARFGLEVTNVYGSSETGGIAWRDDPEAPWRPFPGVRFEVDSELRLFIDSPFLAPEQPRPFACGDRAAPTSDGCFRLLGRADDVVKVAGKRVALAEVEQRLCALEGVREAAAVAVDVEGGRGQEIWVAVATQAFTPEALHAALLKWFDPVALPRRIQVVARLPREENGKLTRRALRALFDDPKAREKPSVTALEPASEERHREGGAEVVRLKIPVREDLLYLRGHFDGLPVLPGVVQLHGLVLRQAQRAWPELRSLKSIKRLQFKRIIQPRQLVELRLARADQASSVDFEITREGLSCASGTLVFGP